MSYLTAEEREARRAAHLAVAQAIADGALERADRCAKCGREPSNRADRIEGHHHLGYAPEHQLEVAWLCVPCHRAAHNISEWQALRESRRLSLREVEELVGINRGLLSRIEHGFGPTPDQARRLLAAFDEAGR